MINPKDRVPNRIAILLYGGVEPMDYQGPCGIFDLWKLEAQGPEVIFVAATLDPLVCAYGRKILPQYDFSNCPPFDALLVPGGIGRRKALKNLKLVEFIKVRGVCRYLLSVCTGTFLLEAADLLSGRRVTTHWEFIEELSNCKSLQVEGEKRYIRDGNIWTSAGIYSGIDMALNFISAFEGTLRNDGSVRTNEAGKIQMIAQYFPSIRRYDPGANLTAETPDFIRAEFDRNHISL